MDGERESEKKPSQRPRKESERACVLCCGETEILAVGKCDHPVCWKCSTRMRVLSQQNYCAVCRKDLDKVVFTTRRQAFASISTEHLRLERKHGIYFVDNVTQKRYRELLEHKCEDCPEKPSFRTFPQLSKHMRKQHELFYCDLCSEHLQIFSWERKTYSRKELAEHRRIGDKNDRSYRGHPLCEFCDERYVDNDSLLRHLRTDHYYCHLCDTGGSNQYYSDYDVLRNHFRDAHFLCEEDECREEKFTSVFPTNIDLKAHQAAVHLKKLSKAQARQARQLDMNFQLVPRQSGFTGRGRGTVSREDYEDVSSNQHPGRRNRKGHGQDREQADQREKAMLAAALKASVQYESASREEEREEERSAAPAVKPDDFPSLGEASSNQGSLFDKPEDFPSLKAVASSLSAQQTSQSGAASTQQSMAMRVGHNFKRSVKNGTLNEEDFPELGANQKKTNPVAPVAGRWMGSEPTPGMSASQRLAQDFPPLQTLKKQSRPVQVAVPKRPQTSGNVNQSRGNTAQKQSSQEEEYPALAANYVPWSKVQVVPTQDKENVNKRAVSQAPPTQDDFPALAPAAQPSLQWTTKKPKQTKTQGSSKWSSLANEQPVDKSKASVPLQEQKAEKKVSEGTAKKKKKKRKKNKGGGSGEEEEKEKVESTEEVANGLKQVVDAATTTFVAEDEDSSKNDATEQAKNNCTEPTTLQSEDSTQRGDGNNTQGDNDEEFDVPSFIDAPSFSDMDFPSLGSDVSSAYFSTALPKEILPLGLGKTPAPGAGPPPGLSQLADSLVQGQVPAPSITKAPPGFQPYTTPEPLAPAPLPLPTVDPGPYIQPDDFQQRNHQLMSSIMECLKENNNIGQFKDFSRKFRQGALPATEYYNICCKLFQKSFSAIFVELLVLLPDARKQQELWQAVTESGRQGSCDISSQCLSCPTCLQIVKNNDFSTHTQKHSLDNDFPALSSVLPPPGLIQDFPSLGEPFGTKKTSAWKKM